MEQGSKPVTALLAARWLASPRMKEGCCCMPVSATLVPMAVQEASALAQPAHASCLSSHTEGHVGLTAMHVHCQAANQRVCLPNDLCNQGIPKCGVQAAV